MATLGILELLNESTRTTTFDRKVVDYKYNLYDIRSASLPG